MNDYMKDVLFTTFEHGFLVYGHVPSLKASILRSVYAQLSVKITNLACVAAMLSISRN